MLSVSGTGFEAGSTVQWNGSSRPTTFVSSTQLTATISAADIQASGNISVTVVNNTRGATSSAVNFRINPVLSSIAISPTNVSLPQGGTQQFTAQATFSDGSSQNVTGTVTWSASPASVITINTAGAATGVAGITSGTGALTLVGSPVTAGALPVSIAVDTAGKFAYVTNFNSNNVSLFSIDATGALTAAAPPVAAGNKPVAVVTAGKIQ